MPTNNAFAPLVGGLNPFTRRWGGTTNAVDPYISGYFFIHFNHIPQRLGENVAHAGGPDGLRDNASIKHLLHSSCLSVTIPGATLNKIDFTGLGGVKWAVPGNVDWDNTVSMRFLEFSTLPLHAVFHGWIRMIRDYRAGVSTLTADNYNKSDYAATVYYWTTKPDGKTVEYYSCLTGVYPTKDPTDLMSAEITTYDKVEIDMDFNVDYLWHEEWVRTNCQKYADSYYNTAWAGRSGNATVDKYGRDDGSEGGT
jgi:hypothetical protein